ncbi:MAG: hypothetical protein MJZ90_09445 [Bacteroidales bacterium]|nr:hypothetical protein [Bacteroidales bacterium]
MSAVVLVLARILKLCSNEQKAKVELMITNSVNYILSQEIDVNKYGSFFPYTSLDNDVDIAGSRLAWCYGDLGICAMLYQAGIAMNRKNWIDIAVKIMMYAAKYRRNLKDNLVADSCFCHGAAGIGHIFYRMWWNTRISEFKDATDYWFEETIKMADFNDGYAGFKKWKGKENGYINETSLLNGIAGIGLALATYSCNAEPQWDRCLLLS